MGMDRSNTKQKNTYVGEGQGQSPVLDLAGVFGNYAKERTKRQNQMWNGGASGKPFGGFGGYGSDNPILKAGKENAWQNPGGPPATPPGATPGPGVSLPLPVPSPTQAPGATPGSGTTFTLPPPPAAQATAKAKVTSGSIEDFEPSFANQTAGAPGGRKPGSLTFDDFVRQYKVDPATMSPDIRAALQSTYGKTGGAGQGSMYSPEELAQRKAAFLAGPAPAEGTAQYQDWAAAKKGIDWRAGQEEFGSRALKPAWDDTNRYFSQDTTVPDTGQMGGGGQAINHGYFYEGAPTGPANADGSVDIGKTKRVWDPVTKTSRWK